MVEACTGVIVLKPIVETASIIHSAKEGVRASHARDDEGIMETMIIGMVRFAAEYKIQKKERRV